MIASRVSQDEVRTGHSVARLSIRALCLHECLLQVFNCVSELASQEVVVYSVTY